MIKLYTNLISAPLCPVPPEVPEEGSLTNDPLVFDLTPEHSCGVDGQENDLFLIV